MDNCQSLIGKLLKHPNVTQIAFQGNKSDFRNRSNTHLCLGAYGNDTKFNALGNAIDSFPNHFFHKGNGTSHPDYSLNILGQQLKILYNSQHNPSTLTKYDPGISLFTGFGLATGDLKEKVMLINYNF